MLTHFIKPLLFSAIFMVGLITAGNQAMAVAIDKIKGLPATTEFTLNVNGVDILGTSDSNGEFKTELECEEGQVFSLFDRSGSPLLNASGDEVTFECSAGIYWSHESMAMAGLAVLAGGTYMIFDAKPENTTTTTATTPASPGPFTACTAQIPGSPDVATSGGPTTFSGTPATLFGTPGHTFTIGFTVGTDPTGGISIAGSVAGICSDTCTTAGTTFPLSFTCALNLCGTTSLILTICN